MKKIVVLTILFLIVVIPSFAQNDEGVESDSNSTTATIQSEVLAAYTIEQPSRRLLILKKDHTFLFAESGRWEFRPTIYYCNFFPSQKYEYEYEDEETGELVAYGEWENGTEQVRQIYLPGGETGERFTDEDIRHILIHVEGEVVTTSWMPSLEDIFEKEQNARLIAGIPGELWSKYVNSEGNFLEFRENGTYLRTFVVGHWGVVNWEIIGDVLITFPNVDEIDGEWLVDKWLMEPGIHKIEDNTILWNYTSSSVDDGDRDMVFRSEDPGIQFYQGDWDYPNKLMEDLKLANAFHFAEDNVFPPPGTLVFFSGFGHYEEKGYVGLSLGDGRVVHVYQIPNILSPMIWVDSVEGVEGNVWIDSCLGWAYPPGG